MAKALGHTITDIKPSLVPLECYEKEECKKLQGLSLKNVKVKLVDKEKNKVIYEDLKHYPDLEMPIVEAVYQVLYEKRKPSEAAKQLMLRDLKSE